VVAPPERERCDLCGEPVAETHAHLLDLGPRAVLCACRACAMLFDHHEAGGRRYRLVPRRCRRLAGLDIDEAAWAALDVPVTLTFLVRIADLDRIVAFCPSPLGLTDARVNEAAWSRLRAAHPEIEDIADDVEALLVHRAQGAREHWLAPIDVCFRLAALVRTRWRGLSGGREVWDEIARFFATLTEHPQR
jgi:hypothetical protein